MTLAPKAGSETTPLYLRYDAWNRMTGVDLNGDLDFIDANEVKYVYDARGMRIAKDFGTGSAQADQNYFFNEKWQVLEVRKDGNVNPLETFAWQMGYIDAPLVRWHDANVDGDVSDAGDSTLYLLYDANYNVTAAVKILVIGQDYVPTVVERYHHTPYGLRTVLNADWTIDTDDPDGDGNYSDYNQTLAHQGGSIDFETGVIKFRHRDLHVSLGLWLERDPLGYVDGGRLYEYVRSRPGLSVDPFGLRSATTQPTTHPTSPKPSKQKDDAGAECCEDEMTVIELRVRIPMYDKPVREQILEGMPLEAIDTGHTYIWFAEEDSYGFYQRPPTFMYGPAMIQKPDVADEDDSHTHVRRIRLCPDSERRLRGLLDRDCADVDKLTYSGVDPNRGDNHYHCTSWALERLADVGVTVPGPELQEPFDLAKTPGFTTKRVR
jgi:RHS repeat-associated protein